MHDNKCCQTKCTNCEIKKRLKDLERKIEYIWDDIDYLLKQDDLSLYMKRKIPGKDES